MIVIILLLIVCMGYARTLSIGTGDGCNIYYGDSDQYIKKIIFPNLTIKISDCGYCLQFQRIRRNTNKTREI